MTTDGLFYFDFFGETVLLFGKFFLHSVIIIAIGEIIFLSIFDGCLVVVGVGWVGGKANEGQRVCVCVCLRACRRR